MFKECDFALKRNRNMPPSRQMVTCVPDIRIENITDDTEFLVIASDGVCWCEGLDGGEMNIDLGSTKDAALFELKRLLEEFAQQRKIRRLEAACGRSAALPPKATQVAGPV
ncbi:hypothetical protein E2562_022234 [Oryza meyeriana var. granulata]|uniref:protein-serine/threonine phosphatase n=1 Tax=Oryza meyeriana var. granulata TaxID=110450 RepID=A0A6G1ENV5_9ORYZ|nr:hypothetical protein E2562_022234 [Oryza meyeriana var. granulata]